LKFITHNIPCAKNCAILVKDFIAQFFTRAIFLHHVFENLTKLCGAIYDARNNLVRDGQYVLRNNMRHAWPRKFRWLMMV
jgi:hypothetical protein